MICKSKIILIEIFLFIKKNKLGEIWGMLFVILFIKSLIFD